MFVMELQNTTELHRCSCITAT